MYAIQKEYFSTVDTIIDEIKRNTSNSIVAKSKIIEALKEKVAALHLFLINHKFDSIEDEIHFFKEMKPTLVSKLIFYSKILDIETNLPTAKEYKTKFLKKEIDKITHYSEENSFFNQYYRSGATHNDEKYFTRTQGKNLSYYECHIINYDIRVSTSHDYNVAQILANDLIIFYLEEKLEQVQSNAKSLQTKLQWTGNRIDLVELIYALQTLQVFNHGNTDIKELSQFFSQIFNINIEDGIYRNYIDIKSRKTDRTKFLSALIESLNSKINEEEA